MTTDSNPRNKARKVFISFLGSTNYKQCTYDTGIPSPRPCRYIQDALLEYFAQNGWDENDVAYIVMTKDSERKNWENDGQVDDKGKVIRQMGLRDCLKALELPMKVAPQMDLPMGNDEKEIEKIFMRLYGLLEEGDELYFDITHSFRYMPMVAMVLLNYSKFLKNVTVKWIGYGNYEGRDRSTGTAPVIDLTSMSMLQDWTTAASDFINNGNAATIAKLTRQRLRPILREAKGADANANTLNSMASSLDSVVNDFKCCRGYNIIGANNIAKLNNSLDNLRHCLIEPLSPLIGRIKESVNDFDSTENIVNGFEATKWCIANNMLQQAATILQETIVTSLCMQHSLDYHIESQRNIVSKALNVQSRDIPIDNWQVNDDEYEPVKSLVETNGLLKNNDFLRCYTALANLRNDLNHCGMRNNPMSVANLTAKLSAYYNTMRDMIMPNITSRNKEKDY